MYQSYAADAFCPPSFHTWTGIGLISTAMERKLWIDHGRYQTFGNLYILMISRPGVGKSTAIRCGVNNVLRHLKGAGANPDMGIKHLSQQSSEAGFYSPQLETPKPFYVGNEKKIQTPGFMQFGEAGNSLKEISGGGSIMKALTEFYDCPDYWAKSLAGRDKQIELKNIYLTMLAGCTFIDLPGIIPRENLEGGLASRFVFVPEFDRHERKPPCFSAVTSEVTRQKLIEDLQDIFEMTGEMKIDKAFQDEWSERHAASDRKLNASPNAQIECLMARRFLTIEKLAMIVSLSESEEKIVTAEHWDRAEILYDAQAKMLPRILENTNIAEDQKTLIESIHRYVSKGNKTQNQLEVYLHDSGVDPFRIKANVEWMLAKKQLIVDGLSKRISNGVPVDEEANLIQALNGFNMETEVLPTEVAEQ